MRERRKIGACDWLEVEGEQVARTKNSKKWTNF